MKTPTNRSGRTASPTVRQYRHNKAKGTLLMVAEVRLRKVGNSYVLTIPPELVDGTGWMEDGGMVQLEYRGSDCGGANVVLSPVTSTSTSTGTGKRRVK